MRRRGGGAVKSVSFSLGGMLDSRTVLSDHRNMKGAEFERRVQKLAKEKELSCFFVADKGKGSHGRLYLGPEFTTLKDRKKELGKGLLGKMCRDLKIHPEEL
jgi:mRNA interferase HicA